MNLYPFAKAVVNIFSRISFRMVYEGTENIPQDQGFIVASNHRSVLDPIFLALEIKEQLHFMAKSELFRFKPFGWLISHLNAFPIRRGQGDTEAMDRARQIVLDQGVLVVFPEGTRSKDGRPSRGRSGVALLAAQTNAAILPCSITYGKRLWFRSTVTVRYGRLITQEELGCDLEKPSSIRRAAKHVMDTIVALMDLK